jgi:hypothetical protein
VRSYAPICSCHLLASGSSVLGDSGMTACARADLIASLARKVACVRGPDRSTLDGGLSVSYPCALEALCPRPSPSWLARVLASCHPATNFRSKL